MKRYLALAGVVVLALSACQQEAATEVPPAAAEPAVMPPAPPAPAPAEAAVAASPASPASFSGYGDMKLGSTIDAARAAWTGQLQGEPAEGSTCHYLLPKSVDKASELGFMMEDGKFVRYDVGTDKDSAPGGGKVGMVVEQLMLLYGEALQSAPDKYVEGGKVYSVAAPDGSPAKLVFQADGVGRVTAWRVGLPPQVDYVEGCS